MRRLDDEELLEDVDDTPEDWSRLDEIRDGIAQGHRFTSKEYFCNGPEGGVNAAGVFLLCYILL